MPADLVKVSQDQLSTLLEWLKKHLPYSWKTYATVRHQVEGLWAGPTYVALVEGVWPNILAVGNGEVDADSCKSGEFQKDVWFNSVYSPDLDTYRTLLEWPGYIDWTKPVVMTGMTEEMLQSLLKVSTRYSTGDIYRSTLMELDPGDLVARSVPPDVTVGTLDPDLHAAYVASTWPYNRTHADIYIADCLERFPSVALFDSTGSILGFELVCEWGAMGFLYVEEKHRGEGYAKMITSLLAQKCFEHGRQVVSSVISSNEPSERLHRGLGFKPLCDFHGYFHHGSNQDLELLKTGKEIHDKAVKRLK